MKYILQIIFQVYANRICKRLGIPKIKIYTDAKPYKENPTVGAYFNFALMFIKIYTKNCYYKDWYSKKMCLYHELAHWLHFNKVGSVEYSILSDELHPMTKQTPYTIYDKVKYENYYHGEEFSKYLEQVKKIV